jgi:hypothetical protein
MAMDGTLDTIRQLSADRTRLHDFVRGLAHHRPDLPPALIAEARQVLAKLQVR